MLHFYSDIGVDSKRGGLVPPRRHLRRGDWEGGKTKNPAEPQRTRRRATRFSISLRAKMAAGKTHLRPEHAQK
eukprot:5725703-Amphidinium_carterae.1